MKRSLPTSLFAPKQCVLLIGLFFILQTARSQTTYTWNGSASNDWTNAANWTPAGIPGPSDNATIVTGSNTCKLMSNIVVAALKVNSGVLDLGGFTMMPSGSTATFSAGTVQNGTLTVSSGTTVTFGNGPMTMNCIVNVTAATVTIKNTTFQKATTITKTGSSNDYCYGGNTFNGSLTVNNTAGGYFVTAYNQPDTYNGPSVWNNTGSNNMYVAHNVAGSVFNASATFNNATSTSNGIFISNSTAGTVFNDSIVVSNTSGYGIAFGGNSTTGVTLSAGKKIMIGSAGFTTGVLTLRQFTQVGATAQSLALTGTGNLTFGPNASFDGNFTASSPTMYLNGAVFNGTSDFTKTGTTGDWSQGGNTFNGVSSFTNTGSSYLLLGSNNPDIWNADVTFSDYGSERLLPCWSSAGNQFNGNVYVNTSGSAQGIQFCGGNTTATVTMAAGKTIQPGSTGLTAGYLQLKQFTQNGAVPVTINATGTSVIYLGPSSYFGGAVTVTSPDIWAQGATYNSPAVFTKTGGTYNHNNQQQNIFNASVTINQQSSGGYFMLGYNSNDLFNDSIILSCTGTGGIYLGWQSGTGTPTQAAGKTIMVGSAGFSAGFLSLNTFTQLGNTPMNLTFTGTNTQLRFARQSIIGGALTASVPDIYLNGATFNDVVNISKTGAGNDWSIGGNTFNASTTLNNATAGYIITGANYGDTCNADMNLNSSGSAYIAMGWNSTGNLFRGNLNVSSTGSSTGIYFGNTTGASLTMSAGATIQVGSAGFTSGQLYLKQFTKLGTIPVNLTLTSSTLLQTGPSSAFAGSFTVTSPRILLNQTVFSDSTSLTKTGSTGEWSYGGNTFNGVTTITHQGSGYFGFAGTAPDIYNADLYSNNNSTERIIFAKDSVGNQYNGNVILTQIGSSVGTAFGWNSLTNLTMAAGKTISIGAAGFSTGYLQIMRFTQLGSAPMNLPLTGTSVLTFGPTSTIGGNLTTTSGGLIFNGCTFNGTVTSVKNGTTGDWGYGNNIFNGVTSITNAGSSFVVLGNTNPDIFNSDVTFNNTGSANLHVAYNSSNNVFNGTTTFNNTPTANTMIYVSQYSAGSAFNGNIVVTSTSGAGVQFCGSNTTATATLAANKSITTGSAGFSSGTLLLRQFTQVGPGASNLLLTGTGTLTYGPTSSFGGDMTGSSPTIFLNGAVFGGVTSLTKTGSTGDFSQGGNVFNGVTTITNTGSSYFVLGNNYADTWNNDVTFTNTGSERLLPCWATAGNQFNGNIYVNTGGSAQGIQFCGGNSTTASATLAAGKSIQAGSLGLNNGYLQLKQFTQLGNAPISLTLASTATYLQYGPGSSLGGRVVSSSPGLYFQGCTFASPIIATKIGSTGDNSIGNNVFNDSAVITNTGTGYFQMGNGNRDQFNGVATFNNNGGNNMLIAYNSANNVFGGVTTFNNAPTTNNLIYVSPYSSGTTFNDNIVVTSTSGQGVQFCNNSGASATLVSGKTISVGSAGFSVGTLLLKQFTQSGSTPINLTLTGTGNLTFGPSSNFGGDVTSVSPTLYFYSSTFNGQVNSTKNGATSDASSGNNTFNGAFTVTNTGAGYFMMGNGNPDTWNSTAVFNNQSTAQHMYVAYNSTGNTFNGNVTFNNAPGATGLWLYCNNSGINTSFNGNITVSNNNGAGVYFGNGTGTSTLSSGGAVSIGAAGFNYGSLILRNFKQVGSGTAQSITTTGTSIVQFGPSSSFDGAITTSSPGILFTTSTFNGSVNSTKTGTSNDASTGNNTFNATTTLTNNGTGYLYMANSGSDVYNGNMVFVQNSTGVVGPNYNYNCTYAGSVTVTSPSSTSMTFGGGTGTATFNGSSAQLISASSTTPTPVFSRLVIANTSSSGVTLNNTSINVSKTLTMTSGLLNTSSSYLLTMLNASTTTVGDANSTTYVNGPMRYIKSTSGSTTLNFPIGKYPDSRPAVLTVNHANTTQYIYTTEVFDASAKALGWTLPPTVDAVSAVHYWTINRTNSSGTYVPKTDLSGNQVIQLYFGSNDIVKDGGTLTICKNTYTATTSWIDIGGSGGPVSTGSNLTGSISCTNNPSQFNSFSTFTLGNMTGGSNVLPMNLLYFRAVPDGSQVDLSWATGTESNSAGFVVERSQDGASFTTLLQQATKATNGISSTPLYYTATDKQPLSGTSYYRLKHLDLDGGYTYSSVVSVNFDKQSILSIFPNPSKGTIYVKGIDVSQTSVKVEWYDISGRMLTAQNVAANYGTAQLTPNFNNGVYVLKVVTADGTVKVQNVIIMK